MALPDARITIEDGALGTLPPNVAGASVKIGVCSKGTPNTIKGYSDIKLAERDLGRGPLVEAMAAVLAVAGGPVYAVPVTPTVAGEAGAVTHEGPGTGTVAVAEHNDRVIKAKVTTAGALGTAAFAYDVDGAGYGSPILSSASAPYDLLVPGTLATVRHPAGTYVLNETYSFPVNGGAVVHRNAADNGAGTGPAMDRVSASPVDVYDVQIEIQTSGGLGVGAFVYSLDGGNNASAVIAIPADGIYPIPGTGLVLTFADTFTAGDLYTFSTTAAGYTSSDVNAALDVATAGPTEWDHVHIVGMAADVEDALTVATGVQVKMNAAEVAYRYAYAVVELPTHEGDAAVAAAVASFAALRVMLCAGDADMVSPITGRVHRRNCAWAVTGRIAGIKPGEDPAWVGRGALNGVKGLYRDEAQTPLLDEGRMTTLRTHRGRPGYYITNGRIAAPGGSDFTYVQNRRVMDLACRITRAAELPYVNQLVHVDEETGFIDEKDAQQFEADVASQLRTGVVAPGNASGASVVLARNINLLSGAEQPVTVRVVPLAYLKNIETSIGFQNPALAAA